MKHINAFIILFATLFCFSCKKYLDIVPDYSPTIDNAFALRNSAKSYLFTCYSYLPRLGEYNTNFTFLASREIFAPPLATPLASGYQNFIDVAYGSQNVNDPVANYWDGLNSGTKLYVGLRTCNIFLENIQKVPDITEEERAQWIAEVNTLKAYYHFFLMRMYGPIPVIRKNLPISAGVDEVQVEREPVDSVVTYIARLVDESVENLPLSISNEDQELGRITKPIALAIKAKALVFGASPLFNGNSDYANFRNKDGRQLISQTPDINKWKEAAQACKDAIDASHEAGHSLYRFTKTIATNNISAKTQLALDIRCAITEDFNSEVIWGFKNARSSTLQSLATAYGNGAGATQNSVSGIGWFAANMEACEMFYTKNGVPIDEDLTWDYENRYNTLKTVKPEDKSYMYPGFNTSSFNIDREARFYADLSFAGSSFFYSTYVDENKLVYYTGLGDKISKDRYSMTGYWPKKLVNYKNSGTSSTSYSIVPYTWPTIRLAELYLFYAEAQNEFSGPSPAVYQYVDSVRARAGLDGVVQSWSQFSSNPSKFSTKEGLRNIIQQEIMIEFIFEGSNYWNMRRWRRMDLLNRPVTGWDVFERTSNTYFNRVVYYQPTNSLKDFLAPIREYNLSVNHNLVQNPLW